MRSIPWRRVVVALLLITLPAAAQSRKQDSLKLNGPLARGDAGYLYPVSISPDGEFFLYATAYPSPYPPQPNRPPPPPIYELYSVANRGKRQPRLLSAPGNLGAQVTLDSKNVLLLGDADGNGSADLQLEQIDGSAPPRILNPPLTGSRDDVTRFQESPGDGHVLFMAFQLGVGELFSVSIAGDSSPVKLNGALAPGAFLQDFALSGNGLAVYSAGRSTDPRTELFVVPVDGSQPARNLPVPLVPGGSVRSFQFDSDASHVLYVADEEEDERYELFSIATDGSQPPRKLNGPLVAGGDVGTRPYYGFLFSLSLDGRWAVYLADQEEDERFDFYSVPADGSREPVLLSASVGPDAVPQLSYDSVWVTYLSDHDLPGSYDLFSVPIDGSAPARRISGPMTPGGGVGSAQFTFDSRSVVYLADQESDQVFELFRVPIDGSAAPVKVNGPLPPGGDVGYEDYGYGFWVTSSGVLFLADMEQDDFVDLYFVPIEGGVPPRKLASGPIGTVLPGLSFVQSPPRDFGQVLFVRADELLWTRIDPASHPKVVDVLEPAIEGDVQSFELAADGDHVIYRAREDGDQVPSYRSAGTSRPARGELFHTELSLMTSPRFVPDGSRLVFLASSNGTPGIYSASADGAGAATLLSVGLGAYSVVGYQGEQTFVISPDGRHVVFLAFSSLDWSLFSAPIDGSSPAVRLSAALPSGSSVSTGMQISADGRIVAFAGNGGLYAVPIDGSTPARLVSGTQRLAPGFLLDTSGNHVVFGAYAGRFVTKTELFVAPTDASTSPLRLSGTLAFGGNVTSFVVSRDGTRVVYIADQTADERFELFSVPIDGSTPALQLHTALSADQDVVSFQVSGDSHQVVYTVGRNYGELELFRAPIDAASSPVRLSADLVPGGGVGSYLVTSDSTRVVYLQRGAEAVELFSTPILGPTGKVKLSRELFPGGDVMSFQVSGDSRTAVYLAEHDPNPRAFTLAAVPIDGHEPAFELSRPFQGAGMGNPGDYRVSEDGSVVVYRADQDVFGVIELYATRLRPGLKGR